MGWLERKELEWKWMKEEEEEEEEERERVGFNGGGVGKKMEIGNGSNGIDWIYEGIGPTCLGYAPPSPSLSSSLLFLLP